MGSTWVAYGQHTGPVHVWDGHRDPEGLVMRCGSLLRGGSTYQWLERPNLEPCLRCVGSLAATEGTTRTETILEEAARIVDGPRQEAYGHPIDDFSRTGRIWGAMLGVPDIHPRTVALMMVGVKLSREMNAPGRDNLVDTAGYARTAELVTIEEERRTR